MKQRWNISLLSIVALTLLGCGAVDTEEGNKNPSSILPIGTVDGTDTTSTVEELDGTESNATVFMVGTVTYDKVGINRNYVGLDHESIKKKPVRQVVVKAIGSSGEVISSTTTDDQGTYRLERLPQNREMKIRIYAQMKKAGNRGWDVRVQDNTNANSVYVLEGKLVSTGEHNSRRSIHASLGWNDSFERYTSSRNAAPFAILDSVYTAMNKVIEADARATFPKLLVNWSVNNIAAGNGSEAGLADGQIVTSHFDGENNLYILGDANSDTDEFDNHIIIHEWGHYFESKFSRADSIGGGHGEGERLDIRVAFGEGWGNAFSAIATNDTIYYDTMGQGQNEGWSMDIEGESKKEPGWFSEASVQRIIYDLYDSYDDDQDQLSLGFKPLYDVLVGAQKNTEAFTSLFTFIKALKDENSPEGGKIDNILASENIASINNIYGNDFYPLYTDMRVGESKNICTSTEYGRGNKLGTHRYIRFAVNRSDRYKISVIQNNGSRSDPDFMLYKTSVFEKVGISDGTAPKKAEESYTLQSGEYLLDISDYNDRTEPCFDVTVNN